MIPKRLILLLILFLASVVGLPIATKREAPVSLRFSGRVVGITDGDTIEVLKDGKAKKVRLYGIDCPERKQPFGTKAREFASGLAYGRNVEIDVMDRDRYGRFVGTVALPDGSLLNHELVRAGYAWWYSRFAAEDRTLQELEREARERRWGLWAQKDPTPPWRWREAKRTSWK